ncbi:MAG: VUT family protein [Caulobacteraceae bacterium]|nr:VUT family protein [Caulobacteraceae bacterium]
MRTGIMIGTYLVAIVAANLVTAWGGPVWSVITSFALIPFNLTIRDSLHERWRHDHLKRNMALLILSGSVLSAVLNWAAIPIATASFVSFILAAGIDTLIYERLSHRSVIFRMATSNSFSAAADSFFFTTLAFGVPILWGIIAADYAVKLIGGLIWAGILSRNANSRTTGH